MTRKEFESLVADVLKGLPKKFKDKLQNVDITIEEDLNVDMVKKLRPGTQSRLLGLYYGVPLKDRTHYYGMVMPDKIILYKQNIELECEKKGLDIYKEIKHVIQHEIAHHFGISDKRLKDLNVY
ncbi:hypothetical protein B9J78_01385 [bacterium Unc6]|nr:hypothetical protein [bacterium Unc6]